MKVHTAAYPVFSLRMPPEMRERLRELADESQRSINFTILCLLDEGLKRAERKGRR